MKNRIRAMIVCAPGGLLFRLRAGLDASGVGVSSTCQRLEEALERSKHEACDVIVAELNPSMTLAFEKFISNMLRHNAVPVVALTTDYRTAQSAMKSGAVDTMSYPTDLSETGLRNLTRDLSFKAKLASTTRIRKPSLAAVSTAWAAGTRFSTNFSGLIALGASTGGTEATAVVMRSLPPNIPPMVIVQHMPPGFTKMYADRLDRECAMDVKELNGSMPLQAGLALVAPGDKHLIVSRREGRYFAETFDGEKRNGHMPSVDVMFESVAKIVGGNSVGIILTGMGRDGATGIRQMRQRGAYTIGQDENSCVVYGMPKVAFDEGGVVKQAPLTDIAGILLSHLTRAR